MKISSKSILSPGRSRDPPISLPNSLSRRLRTNGSIKGGQASPAMFPSTAGKKRGCGFENQEPSSPKVTCIGQVRVKSKKKQGKRLRTLSPRHSGGEVSFRKLEQQQNLNPNVVVSGSGNSYQDCLSGQRNQNQRWVHLPLMICEALRTFGSEFSCLFPCRSSCFSTGDERDKEDKSPSAAARNTDTTSGHSSCGAAFARWLVSLHDGDAGGGGGGGREIELVVGGEDEDEDDEDEGDRMPVRSSRRHVFEDLEIINDRIQLKEEEGRVSICIPPKNALLLMRCRSDPMKMEALANRFWEPSVPINVVDEDDEDDVQEQQQQEQEKHTDLQISDPKDEKFRDFIEANQEQHNVVAVEEEEEEEEEENQEQSFSEEIIHTEAEEENLFLGFLFEEVEDQETEQIEAFSAQTAMEDGPKQEENALGIETEEPIEEKEELLKTHEERSKQEELERETVRQVMEKKEEDEEEEERENRLGVLPECLLLMMCEPKLSMEVSKETWVCSTDFIRRPSDKKKHPVKPINGGDAAGQTTAATKEVRTERNPDPNPCPPPHTANRPPLHHQPRRSSCSQPPRSSCSLPAAASSMATVLEQKLVNAVGYDPFVLTRCKSEPMRTAAKLVPETCFWKNRKLEPLRRASMGVGAAGVGF